MKSLFLFLLLYTQGVVRVVAQKIQQLSYTYADGNGYSCKSNLYINGNESLFTISDDRKSGIQDKANGEVYKLYTDKWSKIFYKNSTMNITRIPIYGKELVYETSSSSIKMGTKTKIIGKFKCQDAIISKGGRNYEIWFNSDTPIQVGPLGVGKVPGLVVELREIGGEGFKVTLAGINLLKDSSPYDSYKKYILGKKAQSNPEYLKETTTLLCNTKRRNNAILAQYNASIESDGTERFYTQHLIDIPDNLVKELQKIK